MNVSRVRKASHSRKWMGISASRGVRHTSGTWTMTEATTRPTIFLEKSFSGHHQFFRFSLSISAGFRLFLCCPWKWGAKMRNATKLSRWLYNLWKEIPSQNNEYHRLCFKICNWSLQLEHSCGMTKSRFSLKSFRNVSIQLWVGEKLWKRSSTSPYFSSFDLEKFSVFFLLRFECWIN